MNRLMLLCLWRWFLCGKNLSENTRDPRNAGDKVKRYQSDAHSDCQSGCLAKKGAENNADHSAKVILTPVRPVICFVCRLSVPLRVTSRRALVVKSPNDAVRLTSSNDSTCSALHDGGDVTDAVVLRCGASKHTCNAGIWQ